MHVVTERVSLCGSRVDTHPVNGLDASSSKLHNSVLIGGRAECARPAAGGGAVYQVGNVPLSAVVGGVAGDAPAISCGGQVDGASRTYRGGCRGSGRVAHPHLYLGKRENIGVPQLHLDIPGRRVDGKGGALRSNTWVVCTRPVYAVLGPQQIEVGQAVVAAIGAIPKVNSCYLVNSTQV